MVLSVPAALVVGIVGIFLDKRKTLAVITTLVAGAFVFYYVFCIFIAISTN